MSQGAHISRLGSILALVAALLTLASTSSGTAIGAFKGSNGKLAFVRAGDIWVIAADGSVPTRLTTHPASDRSPRFSPDGAQIAFSSNRDGDFEIYVMSALGGDVAQQLTFNEGEQDRFPSWTAEGTQIIYDKSFSSVYSVPVDGSGAERKLADGFLPGTSPQAQKMVFASPTNDGLVTVHLDGSGRRQITTGHADFAANWAPSGNDLVFTRSDEAGRDVYVAHSDGSAVQGITSTPDRFEFAPVWSPDGEKIAFVGCPVPSSGADCLLYVVRRDGTGETQLSSLEVTGGEGSVDWQPLTSEPGEWKTLGTLRYREEVVEGDLIIDFEERGLNRFSAVDYRLDAMVDVFRFSGGQGTGQREPATVTALDLVPDAGGRVIGSLTLDRPGTGGCGCSSTLQVHYAELRLTNVSTGQIYRLDAIGASYSN